METIDKCTLRVPHEEDLWFAKCFSKLSKSDPTFKVKLAPRAVSRNFSVETIPSFQPFGVHKPWLWLNPDQLEHLVKFCPELHSIMPRSRRDAPIIITT
jgi:hypothetical protein